MWCSTKDQTLKETKLHEKHQNIPIYLKKKRAEKKPKKVNTFVYDISVNVFLLSTNKQKRSGQNVFLYCRFFFLRFETSQAPTTNNSENRDRTNKQTRKQKQKNSTMIDDRRLLKPANEKNKQKNTEIFPQYVYIQLLLYYYTK